MTNNDLYNTLLRILRKESKGLAVSPDAFTDLLKVENLTLFNEYYKIFEVNHGVTDSLRTFKSIVHLDQTYDGRTYADKLTLPSDYAHITALQINYTTVQYFRWTDQPYALGYNAFTITYPADGETQNITSLVSTLQKSEAITEEILLDAGSSVVLRAKVTDTSLSSDSDMPQLYLVIDGEDSAVTTLVEGDNYFDADVALGSLYVVVRSSETDNVDVSIDFNLTILSDTYAPTLTAVDIVTDEEWMARHQDALTIPSTSYPIGRISGSYIYVSPKTDSVLYDYLLYYLKQPADPFYDYYTDANYNIQYLAASASYTLQTSEVYRDGTSSGTVTSATVELAWEDTEKIKILHRILAKMGVSMDEQLVAQYATSKENA